MTDAKRLDSFEDDAEDLFRAFAMRHNLFIEKENQTEVELLMTVPQQDGLSFELTLGLQNGDEINIGFNGFWSSIYPFSSVKSDVETLLDGIVTGNTRLAIQKQFGRVYIRKLETLKAGNWISAYLYFTGVKVPFVKSDVEYFYNEA